MLCTVDIGRLAVDWRIWFERQPATVPDGALVYSVCSSLRLFRPEDDSIGVEEDSPQQKSHRHQPRPARTARAGDTCRMSHTQMHTDTQTNTHLLSSDC